MNLNQKEWSEQLKTDDDAVILDVRTPEEWEEGIIPGAKLIDIYTGAEFVSEIQSLDKSKSYYVYCKAGGRSQQACQVMNQLGFEKTYNLLGGMSQWQGDVTQM